MTVFAGHYGDVQFQRLGSSNVLDLQISAENLDVARKRIALTYSNGADLEWGLITTGDRLQITTTDTRGLPFRFYTNSANTVYEDNPGSGILPLEFFANVDAMGQMRMYRTFGAAMQNSNDNYLAIPLSKSASDPAWSVKVKQLPGAFNSLGRVQSFTLNTERNNIDTTALGDKYQQYESAQVNGSGTVDCLFDFKALSSEELPVALCQLVQKVEIGSKFRGKFYLLEPGSPQPPGVGDFEGVYYEVDGIMTRAGIEVGADQIVDCSFDFIVNGEFKLRAGVAPVDLTTEDDVSIVNENTLEQLGVLQEQD